MNDATRLIDDNAVVSMHYRLSNGMGEVIDESRGQLPLVYMHNSGALLASLERELTGCQTGDELHVVIAPEDGYGYPDESLIKRMPRSAFAHIETLSTGMRIKAIGEEDSQMLTVVEIDDVEDEVVVDGNHPLAGQVLVFELAIVSVREPTQQELDQGYAVETNVSKT